MKPVAVVLSGKVCAGKTTLAERLRDLDGATLVKSKDLIYHLLPGTASGRRAAQLAGQRLDRETNGRWLCDALLRDHINHSTSPLLVVDAVRIPNQIKWLRESGAWTVVHVHLQASHDTLSKRYSARTSTGELEAYDELSKNWTERHVSELSKIADVWVDTDLCSGDDVHARIAGRLGLRPVLASASVDVLVGGQYGSEGKGNIANFLATEYDVLVRVGGPNAGHKVYRNGQKPYTFRQLPSGALGNKDATLVVGAGAVVDLGTLLREVAELSIDYRKLLIDPQAMIISDDDKTWETEHLKGAIGSTAQGAGRATARKILGRLPGENSVQFARDIPQLKHYVHDTVNFFAGCLAKGKKIMLEGTQGTSLSLHHGSYPHVTSRVTTVAGCLAEAGLAPRHVRRVLMVCRTYPIRVGDSNEGKTSGPMSQEIRFEDIAKRSGIPVDELTHNEVGSVSGRPRRVGEFDWAQVRRSLMLNGATDIALTFADYLGIDNRKAYRYEQLTDATLRFIEELEKVCGVPVSIISTDFSARNIIDRRMW